MLKRLILVLLLLRAGDLRAEIACKASPSLVSFVESWEGYVGIPYRDGGANRLAIGFGFQTGVKPHWRWSREKATRQLTGDLDKLAAKICKAAPRRLKQHELDALTSLAYNIGFPGLIRGKLFKEMDGRRFVLYIYSGGKKLKGLLKRRKAEQRMWYGKYNSDR